MSEAVTTNAVDESWPMVEEAVFRLFDELAAKGTDEHLSIGPRLAELGWSDIESEYPIEACELLFRAQGRSLLNSDSLDKVLLAELAPLLDGAVDGIVLPGIAHGYTPGSDAERVCWNIAWTDAERPATGCSGVEPEGHGVNRDHRHGQS